jgi:hypothetical protein
MKTLGGVVRLWSVHPKHLDTKGLVALWREGLLALAVLKGKTRGYKNHPQLERFRETECPVAVMQSYLMAVRDEAMARGYHFRKDRLGKAHQKIKSVGKIPVTQGQFAFEAQHLLRKLKVRSPERARDFQLECVELHPLFFLVEGGVASWERV